MNKQTFLIYLAGLLQGMTLVAFPASSTILTSPDYFHLTSTQYGSLFLPQALFSIMTALFNPWLRRHFGSKNTLLIGVGANLCSMMLLVLSALFEDTQALSFCVLLLATSCLGLGFGTLVPTINRMAEELYPSSSNMIILALNALLGVGTTLSPVFIALFSHLGFWWGLPLMLSLALLGLLAAAVKTALPEEHSALSAHHQGHLTTLGRIFIAFAFLYGIIETLNGNWVSIYLRQHMGASLNIQALALTAFWGMVTFGRVFFSAMSKFLSEQLAFQIAPFLSAIAFVIIASLVPGQNALAVAAFGLIGFGCSVLLPLAISFGGEQLKAFAPSVPGMIISSYLLGYAVAAFGVGPLQDFTHITLRGVYLAGAGLACLLGFLSIYIIKKQEINHG